jgi:hypothetical protein
MVEMNGNIDKISIKNARSVYFAEIV